MYDCEQPPAGGDAAQHERPTASERLLNRAIPEATVQRLPVYLRGLVELAERGEHTVSSEALAAAAGVNSAKVRKDLSYLGSYGTRGVGYDVEYLIHQVSRELGLTQDWATCIVGIGNLGVALANYRGFVQRGFRISALFDSAPEVVGTTVAGLDVHPVDEIDRVVKEERISIGVLAVPAAEAQPVTDALVAAGVSSILNFAPVVLQVPDEVSLRKVDLSIELQILSFYEQRRAAEESVRAGAAREALERAHQAADDLSRTLPENSDDEAGGAPEAAYDPSGEASRGPGVAHDHGDEAFRGPGGTTT
ncbi:redox-sensing transcriptional repressor Rex [Egibacter rhizosphaerae]|uniref:redox-sensing transcriptional repressor Rex n=1 Tax=Egibacter rhizosphaerae TaxID=1670831 RepID=UPI003B838926